MKSFTAVLVFAFTFAALALAQETAPKGTVTTSVDKDHTAVVQPAKKHIRVSPETVEAAQKKLNSLGDDAGPVDGKLGAKTQAALRKYQQDENLPVTGRLDQKTMAKLDVGGGSMIASAPGDIGRGAKAAGHDVINGHPVAGAKAIGKGFGRAGKAVGEGTKAGVVGNTKDKVNQRKSSNSSVPR